MPTVQMNEVPQGTVENGVSETASVSDSRRTRRSGGVVNRLMRVARRARTVPRLRGEEGAATAEYAVATMAAVGFAGLLIVILRGDEVRGILTDLVRNALTVG